MKSQVQNSADFHDCLYTYYTNHTAADKGEARKISLPFFAEKNTAL
jgi:hypothetical protein